MPAFHQHVLVYHLPSRDHYRRADQPLDASVSHAVATPANVRSLFAGDPELFPRFNEFLERGYVGIFLYDANGWLSCGWTSTPDTLGPLHLSRRIRRMRVFWPTHFRTHPNHRRRGLFKKVMQLIIEHAYSLQPDAEIYGDTGFGALASRHVLLNLGWQPCGIATTYRIPKLNVKWTRWRKDAPHPPLP